MTKCNVNVYNFSGVVPYMVIRSKNSGLKIEVAKELCSFRKAGVGPHMHGVNIISTQFKTSV